MKTTAVSVLPLIGAVAAVATPKHQQRTVELLTDMDKISQNWGQISPYRDNADNLFGVEDIGLPDGCQIEQVHDLQRHADRFPTSYFDDGINDENFVEKVANFTSSGANASFSGPLTFLNSYTYMLGESYLTGKGAVSEFTAGVSFWNRYGRVLYDAAPGQLAYNASYPNGTARAKPVLRTTGQSRIQNSQISWALGFFGTSFQAEADPELTGANSAFDVVVIPEGGTENNTLASYDACSNDWEYDIGYIGDFDVLNYLWYLDDATARLQQYAPEGFTLTNNDTYAMQSICAYESAYMDQSDFCYLFTADEWAGFEHSLDIEYYYDYSWGNPTGRAQGLGYLQELLARLQNEYIFVSNSSVNSTLTNNPDDFPLGRPFYADFTHDDIILSTLTAMSVDYFREPPSLTTYPPDPDRVFVIGRLTEFGSRLFTEVIGCADADPTPVKQKRTSYTPGQYGYDASNASNKFIRMRLNNAIVPLDSIRGGGCGNRTDGLCPLDDFIKSQAGAEKLANWDYACYGNYTLANGTNGTDYDGTIFA